MNSAANRARPTQRFISHRSGFTLLELMISLAILAVLATLVLPVAQVAVQRQKEERLRTALRELRSAIDAYKRAADEGRIERAADASGYPPNLRVLAEGVVDARSPLGHRLRFLRRIPRDPFAVDTLLDDADTWATRSYDSDAAEPQEGVDVYDVQTRSPLLGLNGQALRQW